MVPYHGTTISFSWDFCYTFLHTSYYLEEVSEMKKKEEEEDFSIEVNNNLLPMIFQQLVHKLVQWNSYFPSWPFECANNLKCLFGTKKHICTNHKYISLVIQ